MATKTPKKSAKSADAKKAVSPKSADGKKKSSTGKAPAKKKAPKKPASTKTAVKKKAAKKATSTKAAPKKGVGKDSAVSGTPSPGSTGTPVSKTKVRAKAAATTVSAAKKPSGASRARKSAVSARVKELVGDALPIADDKALLKNYYAGNQMPSPNGGFLMPLGVRGGEDGSALLFLECSASSLRYWMEIPKATRTERKKVSEVIDAGADPDCPRHGAGHRLVRIGRDLACPLCGVAYGKT